MFACKCPKHHLALSFYRSKTLLDRSKLFWTFQIILDMLDWLWQVQKWHFLVLTTFSFDPWLSKTFWTSKKIALNLYKNKKSCFEPQNQLPPLTWVSNAINRTGFKPISYRFKHTRCLTHISWCVSYSHLKITFL